MIRPEDIQQKIFSRGMRGYKEEEVNEFLDQLTIDMDILLNDLKETQEENSRLVEELERVRTSEGSLVETLQAAKSLMADISASADKRAEVLIKNAELDAELMKKNAREDADSIARESEAMKQRYIKFRNGYKRLLESELRRFESLSGDLLPEFGVDDFDDLPQAPAVPPDPDRPTAVAVPSVSERVPPEEAVETEQVVSVEVQAEEELSPYAPKTPIEDSPETEINLIHTQRNLKL